MTVASERFLPCTHHDGKVNTFTINHDHLLSHERVAAKNSAMIVVALLVISLHAGLLMLIMYSSPAKQTTLTSPAISGTLIQMPSTDVVKTTKKKTTPVPKPKPLPVQKKSITLPPVIKPPLVPEIQETIETVKENLAEAQVPIVAPRVDATRRSNPAPVYPRGSLRRKETGKVILELLILVDGSVGEVHIKQSSGFKRLDRSAIKAVKRWRYIPAQQGGQAIEYRYQQPIIFALRK